MNAARLGPRKVWATDHEKHVLELLRLNTQGVSTIEVRSLIWGLDTGLRESIDVLIGSDIFFDSSLYPALRHTILSLRARLLIFTLRRRSPKEETQFFLELKPLYREVFRADAAAVPPHNEASAAIDRSGIQVLEFQLENSN